MNGDGCSYRKIGGPATLCDYYFEGRGGERKVKNIRAGKPTCADYSEDKGCPHFQFNMCRFLPSINNEK